MTMKLTPSALGRMRAATVAANDHEIAAMFRKRNADEVAHLSDETLLQAIREAREAAMILGLERADLRMRFIMLGVFRLPRFWMDETIADLLNAPTGTPDIRFGDVCAMFKLSAERAGNPAGTWWS